MTEKILFSPSTCGAYLPYINGVEIPEDAIELPLNQWQALLAELSISAKRIGASADGFPILIDPPPLDAAQLALLERSWRDVQLSLTDPVVSRHRDEVEAGGMTTLKVEQYTELQAYRRQLRDWPQGAEFPLADHRPVAPAWLSTQLQ
jgi:hypothetical protein